MNTYLEVIRFHMSRHHMTYLPIQYNKETMIECLFLTSRLSVLKFKSHKKSEPTPSY